MRVMRQAPGRVSFSLPRQIENSHNKKDKLKLILQVLRFCALWVERTLSSNSS